MDALAGMLVLKITSVYVCGSSSLIQKKRKVGKNFSFSQPLGKFELLIFNLSIVVVGEMVVDKLNKSILHFGDICALIM